MSLDGIATESLATKSRVLLARTVSPRSTRTQGKQSSFPFPIHLYISLPQALMTSETTDFIQLFIDAELEGDIDDWKSLGMHMNSAQELNLNNVEVEKRLTSDVGEYVIVLYVLPISGSCHAKLSVSH